MDGIERREIDMEYSELFNLAKSMGMTDQSADEMANEHIARMNDRVPSYVRAHLNAAIDGKITSKKVQKFLDKKFGFNSENVHRFLGLYINRKNMGDWYICS